ncbi:transcriptional regulator, LuxR family protein [gamma proteobacterium HTCC5015]|nr:transcriptional regulator, LuxR family protein [gamma proteobacterium HTCC5015]
MKKTDSQAPTLPQRNAVSISENIPDLIHTLYSALNHPEGFHPFLDRITHSINGCAAQLSTIRKAPIQLEHLWYSGLSDDFLKWYLDNNMIEHDVVSNHAVTQAPGHFQSAIPLLDHYTMEASYARWESDQDMLDSAWLVVEADEHSITLLTIQRTVAQGVYQQSELAQLNQLTPYIRQAVQLHRQIAHQYRVGSSLEWLFNHLAEATFILDDRANVLYSNRAAKTLLQRERCLKIADTRFQFSQDQLQHDFVRSSVRVARSSIGKENFYSHSLFLPRPQKTPLTLMIKPLESNELMAGGAIVTVYDHSHRTLPNAEAIAAYFSLSPAEATLCEDLITGLSLKDIAARQHKAEATLRTYLKNIFRKTEHNSQGQLISSILSALLH